MKNFIYETPTKVYFGAGEELRVGKLVKEFSPKKVLIHYGGKSAKESGLLDRVKKCLNDEDITYRSDDRRIGYLYPELYYI